MHQIDVANLTVNVVRKDIKNLHLAVYPPNGQVRVAVPLRVNDEAVRLAVISKLSWIKRQQAQYTAQNRQSAREYVSGESHYFQGQRYRLNVISSAEFTGVKIRNKSYLDLYVRPESLPEQRERLLTTWYRQQLHEEIMPLIEKWTAIIGVPLESWAIKRMKTKWGTCNIEARRIWLNQELIKKPVHCLEYIIVHELVHLLERHHNERFTAHMDRFLPQWRFLRDELNKAPLAHERWDY
jgi:predicted metal-dependent hydrolase